MIGWKKPLLKEFEKDISDALDMVKRFNQQEANINDVYLVAELSLLKIDAAWEQLLEDVFVQKIVNGKMSMRGKYVSYIKPVKSEIVHEIINRGRPYSKWSYEDVQPRAIRYFKNGEPFSSTLRNIQRELGEISYIRNRIAHDSLHSDKKFKEVVLQRLGAVPNKITPGQFLLGMDSATSKTYLVMYADTLLNACKNII